jgi:hypothetical protein
MSREAFALTPPVERWNTHSLFYTTRLLDGAIRPDFLGVMLGTVLFTGSVLLTRTLSRLKRDSEKTSPNKKTKRDSEKASPLSPSEKTIGTTNQIENLSFFIQNQLPDNWQQFRSQQNGTKKCEVEVVNNMAQSTAIFCWIGFDGTLHHFRCVNDRSIKDGSVPNWIVEFSTIFHAFVCFKPYTDCQNAGKLDQLDPKVGPVTPR